MTETQTQLEPLDGLFQVAPEQPEEPKPANTCARVGAAAITVTVAAGAMVIAASVLKLITWAIGGIAGVLTAVAPWVAVLLGIAAYSAYVK